MATLTEQHRQAQLVIRAATMRDLLRLWPAVRFTDLDATFPAWASAVSTLVGARRAMSSQVAAAYYTALRGQQAAADPFRPVLATPVESARLAASLQVTAYAGVKKAASLGVTQERAMANAFVRSSGAVTRLVLEGGRQTVLASTKADPAAKGYRRVTGGKACEFCTMLAGRGAVYSADTADFHAHDHCGCSPEPSW